MYDIQFFRPSTKEMAVAVLVSVVLLVGAFCFGYCIGIRNVSDNGTGTEPIGNELGQVGTNIGNAESGIDNASQHIANGTESVDYLQGTVATSEDIIRQSKSIIERIRRRGETQAK